MLTPIIRRFSASLGVASALAGLPVQAQRAAAPRTPQFDVYEKSILDLTGAMESRQVTSRQLVEQYFARIKAYDQDGPRINAFIALNPRALEAAAALDAERRAGRVRGPLHGVPIVVKDNYATADMPTTAGSLALEGFETKRDAFMVKKLRDAGVVFVGKTNLHELATGITSISSMGGQTRNPYDPTRNPGGSSGGTGAAVAANFAVAGLGTDTCGSIRNPSADNNLFGLRGTAGLSSRDGIVPLSHTQDIGGPLARTMTDLALLLDATVGFDPADPTTAASQGRIPPSYASLAGEGGLHDLRDVRIGIVPALFGAAPEDAEVGGIVRRAIDVLRGLVGGVFEITIPGYDEALQGAGVIGFEFKFDLMDYLAPFPGAPVHSLDDILSTGLYHNAVSAGLKRQNAVESRHSEPYSAALAKRGVARQTILAAMQAQGLTTLAYPTLRRKPAVIGEPQAGSNCGVSASTGLPAMSIPAGFTEDGLPIGLELLGGPFTEATLIKVAFAYERAAHPRRPPPTTPPLRP